jgi:hypothetical protein
MFRFGVRTLRRDPAFPVAATLTLPLLSGCRFVTKNAEVSSRARRRIVGTRRHGCRIRAARRPAERSDDR